MNLHLFFAILNFLLFVGLLHLLLRRPMREFWSLRSEALRVSIAKAHEKRTIAETKYTELESRMERLGQEMHELKDRLRADGELEKEKILEGALQYATRLEAAAKRVAEQELLKARYRLKVLAASAAVEHAERVISDAMDEADQKRLASEYLDQLATEDLQPLEGGLA